MDIPDSYALTELPPLFSHAALYGPANAQHCAMRVQVLLAMGQYRLSKEEAGELLDQWVHVVTTTHEICHRTRNFVCLMGDYFRDEGPFSQAMATWPRHIDQLDQQ